MIQFPENNSDSFILYEEELKNFLHIEKLDELMTHDALNLLGMLVNEADDTQCLEKTDKALDWCKKLNSRECTGKELVRLHYNWANAWAARRHILSHNVETSAWEWDHPESAQELLHLRIAMKEPDFITSPVHQKCTIYVNVANILDTLGRPTQAIEYWNLALQLNPNFGMALGNLGYGLKSYAHQLYDGGHAMLIMKFAYDHFMSALNENADFETSGYEFAKEGMAREANDIAQHMDCDEIVLNLNEYSLGDSQEEKEYRQWSLKHKLFLNPLNDLGAYPIAAHDVFGLPSITTAIKEPPALYGFFNQLKQEYASARFLYYEGITSEGVHFSDLKVSLYNTLDYPAYSLAVERVKVAFRLLYSLFDKIAYFINSYWNLGIPEKRVNFHSIWVENKVLRETFDQYENLPMRGLYWLSKDILENDDVLKDSLEPDAEALKDVRNHLEHKYLKVHDLLHCEDNCGFLKDTLAFSITRKELDIKTLRMLKLAREGLIYLSLAVHREESLREEKRGHSKVLPITLSSWSDDWKR